MSSKRVPSKLSILIGTLLALLAGYWLFVGPPFSLGNTASVDSRAVFYRLLAKYQHGDEIVDFDIVVGCGVVVTRYGDGDRSYEAFRDPTVYAKATKDGGAIWQIVPSACGGGTSETGEVPEDFLPGALWFEDKTDFSLGIAYVTEDAFESPKSKLKFLGASIHKATRDEWVAFQPIAAQNLIEPRIFTQTGIRATESEVKANLWNKAKLNEWLLSSYRCRGIDRYEVTSAAGRAFLRTLQPASRPKFWMPPRERYPDFLGHPDIEPDREQFAYLGEAQGLGFPTRNRGGRLRSGKPWSKLPPTIFPMRADEGIPWVTPDIASSPTIYRDIDIDEGSRGLAYCYSRLTHAGVVGKFHIPDYLKKSFPTRVGGEFISGEEMDDTAAISRPRPFFQDDRYFYRDFSFGLN